MKRSDVDAVARDLFDYINPEERRRGGAFPMGEFGDQEGPCKAFYRRIARWHLRRLTAERTPLLPLDAGVPSHQGNPREGRGLAVGRGTG